MKSITVTELNNIWNRVLSIISSENDKNFFDAFFAGTKLSDIKNDTAYILVDSDLSKTILQERYTNYLEQKLLEQTETTFKVQIISSEENISLNENTNDLSTSSEFFKNNIIDPNFTFDNFVVGPSNNEAHKASLIVATSPGTLYQTLFIYGGSGLGKTHLLNAIGNYLKELSPEKKILLCSSQDFLNEYLDFVNGNQKKEQLIKHLKKYDVFLIDDIQMLKDKRKTQEFFFNIYEDFRQNHKQVVLTSDKLPCELDGIDTRLITRFTSGLSVPVHKPDTKTCREILLKKIVTSGFEVSRYDEDVILFLSEKFKDSVRNLEGALIRLNFYASINRVDHIDLNLCTQALQGMVDVSDAGSKVSEQKILNMVAEYYNLSVSQITGKVKASNIVYARHIAIYLIRTILNTPYKKIGSLFSNRDHTTIMHSVEKVEKMLKEDTQVQIVVEELKKRLNAC